MAAEFRKKKCHHFFYTFMDQNKDGSIDKQDMDYVVEKITQLKGWKSDEPKRQQLRDQFYKVLDGMLEEMDTNHDGKISFEEYVALHNKNAKNPSEWHNLFGDAAYNCVRCNETGVIKEKDYVNIMLIFGFERENAVATFKAVSKGKDTIYREDYKILWREYFFSDDPNAPGNLLCGVDVL